MPEVEKISTLTRRKVIVAAVIILFIFSSSAQIYSNSRDYSGDENFSIPNYDSQQALFGKLIAPFLLITIVLQIGIQYALFFTLDANGSNSQLYQSKKSTRKKARKYSIVMSLLITSMLIPTPVFQNFDLWIALIFGSTVYLIFGLILFSLIYIIYKVAS